jgi:photosystem II stability/assembly factor-like uncharacterized protein
MMFAQVWTPQISGSSAWLEKAEFVNDQVGWCVGSGGTILHTTNGGATWAPQISGTSSYLRDIHMLDVNSGWIVGQDGTVLHTIDGGSNWVPLPFPSVIELRALWVISPDTIWVTGTPDIMYRSVDGGMVWEEMLTEVGDELNSLWFLEDGSHGWAAGLLTSDAQGQSGQVRITTDGGQSWVLSTASQDLGWFQSIQFTDEEYGWSCTADGRILRSVDGGVTWATDQIGPGTGFFDLLFIDESEGWCVGGSGVIWHTFNAGASWIPEGSNTTQFLYDIEALPNGKAWAVGAGGTILHRSSGTTSVHDNDRSSLSIYPVPAADEFFVSLKDDQLVEVLLYDAAAREVRRWKNVDRFSPLDVTGLEPGQFTVRVTGSNSASSIRPIIISK